VTAYAPGAETMVRYEQKSGFADVAELNLRLVLLSARLPAAAKTDVHGPTSCTDWGSFGAVSRLKVFVSYCLGGIIATTLGE